MRLEGATLGNIYSKLMEERINLPPFYEGQRVVYIGKGTSLAVNSTHTVTGINQLHCGCWSVQIGLRFEQRQINGCDASKITCGKHIDKTKFIPNPLLMKCFDSTCFAPIELTFQSISFENVIKKETPLVGVN